MLRAMILVLTLLLVTLSAAYLGQDEQLTQVLRLAKTPVTSLPEESSNAAESEMPPPASSSQASSSQSSSTSPRFVLDEPLSDPPPLTDPDASSATDDPHPDPSAHAQLYSADQESKPYELIPPSEEQKLTVAEPYIKELFELKDRNVRAFGELADEALSEYLSIPPDTRATSLPDLMEKYLPRVNALEAASDAESEAILRKMTAALAAIGADDLIAQDARAAYERSKQEQLAHYTELFSSLPS